MTWDSLKLYPTWCGCLDLSMQPGSPPPGAMLLASSPWGLWPRHAVKMGNRGRPIPVLGKDMPRFRSEPDPVATSPISFGALSERPKAFAQCTCGLSERCRSVSWVLRRIRALLRCEQRGSLHSLPVDIEFVAKSPLWRILMDTRTAISTAMRPQR